MPGTPRYRGLRRTANREALLGAAEELFSTRSFGSVSVDEIVARAGVAKGTFYNHFADKQALAASLAMAIRHSVRDSIAGIKTVSTDPAMHLAIAVAQFLGLALIRPNRALILVTLLNGAIDTGASMNQPLRDTLAAGKKSGRFAIARIDTALISVLGIVSTAVRYLIQKSPTDPEPHQAEFVSHVLAAVHFVAPSEARAIAQRAVTLVANAAEPGRD